MTSNLDELDQRVDRVFIALQRMNEPDFAAMHAAWTAGNAQIREQAWTKINAKLRGDTQRTKILHEARNNLVTWVNDVGISWGLGAYGRSVVMPSGIDQVGLRRDAVPAALDAIAAMLVDEVLDDDERDELLEPLRRVTEPFTPAND